jgi:chromosome segregation ATPase
MVMDSPTSVTVTDLETTALQGLCPNWPHPGITTCEFCVEDSGAAVRELARQLKDARVALANLEADYDRLEADYDTAEQRVTAMEADRDRLQAAVDRLNTYVDELESERDRYREALEQIVDTSPNWMQADAVADSERRMRDIARAALAAGAAPEETHDG